MTAAPLLWALAVALVLVGLAGTLLPALPGPILVFAGLWLAAWADGFARVGWPTLVLCGLLTGAAYLVDLAAAALGVRRFGASRRAAAGAALGTLLGLFLGLPGLIAGPFIGAVLGEVWARRALQGAGKAGAAAWVGFLVGSVVKLAIVFAMVGIFLAALVL
jgi:uncharacterized protein YqgC (DUF456 family)